MKHQPTKEEIIAAVSVTLYNVLSFYLCSDEWHYEYFYSKLLDHMVPLIMSVLGDKTKWRLHETLITKLGNVVCYFNANEL
jgi:hypothetical protein